MFRVSKNFVPKSGISRFSIENLFSHSAKKLRGGIILCFGKVLVSKSKAFMDIRGGGLREGGNTKFFSVK